MSVIKNCIKHLSEIFMSNVYKQCHQRKKGWASEASDTMTSALVHYLREPFNVNVSKAAARLLHSIELFIWLLYAQDVYCTFYSINIYHAPLLCDSSRWFSGLNIDRNSEAYLESKTPHLSSRIEDCVDIKKNTIVKGTWPRLLVYW